MDVEPAKPPLILPLGDHSLVVRFAATLSESGNRAAIAFARHAANVHLPGVVEIVPNLVSVLLRYDPAVIEFDRLAGDVRLLVSAPAENAPPGAEHAVNVTFDGEDTGEVAALLGLTNEAFIAAHCAQPLRVLATGFAPGFVYLGFHDERLHVSRRAEVRLQVPAGTVLFAAGQTAITSTAIPTGWHVIGRTGFRNFDPTSTPPTRLAAGDMVHFEAAR